MTEVSSQDVSKAMGKIAAHYLGSATDGEAGSLITYATAVGNKHKLHLWANDEGPEVDATNVIDAFIATEEHTDPVASFVRNYKKEILEEFPKGNDVTHVSSDGSWQLEVDECPQEIATARINFTVLNASE